MSDPEVAETQEPTAAENADASEDVTPEAKPEEGKADEPSTESDKPESDAEKTASEPKPKKTSKSQKRIAELSYQNREQGRRLDRALDIIDKQNRDAPATGPKIEDFETNDGYLDARDSHKAKEPTDDEATPEQRDYQRQTEQARNELFEFGTDRHEDFEDVVLSHENITPVMRDAIFEINDLEAQSDVAYFLGKNKKDAARISRLSQVRQILEIGKLEAKITSPAVSKKRPSAAPKPVTPVGGGNTTSDTHNPDDDMATFIRKRNKELGRG